jgi:ribose transport system permease protein
VSVHTQLRTSEPAARRALLPTWVRTRPWAFALVLAVALVIANALTRPSFLDPGHWPTLLGTLAPFVLVALASTPPILGGGGGIDISVGPLATFVNCVFVVVLIPAGLGSPVTAIPLLLLIGIGVGLVNGLLVVVARLQPVIATLATFFVLTGLSLKLSAVPTTAPPNWTQDLAATLGVVPGGLITIGAAALLWAALRRTGYVRTLYAVGSDDVACFSAGVGVARVRVGSYVVAGVFATIAGIALTAVIQSSEASLATTYSLIALAGVSLGGTSFAGGRGGLLGSFLGACCIFLLQEWLSATGVSTNYVQFVYGFLLVIGVVFAGSLAKTRSDSSR